MNSNSPRMGIDLGGTKIEALVLDGGGAELVRERVATPSGDYPATLQALADLVGRLEARVGCRCRVGIGMPGAFSLVTGRVKNSNSVCLNGQPLHQDLETLLQRPLRFANDAHAVRMYTLAKCLYRLHWTKVQCQFTTLLV